MRHRTALFCVGLLCSAIMLTACAPQSHLTDANPVDGNPRIVVSDVSVAVTDYVDAVTPSGGLVVKQGILGWVVMSRAEYVKMLQQARGSGVDRIFDVYARTCREDKDGCNRIAAGRVQKEIGN